MSVPKQPCTNNVIILIKLSSLFTEMQLYPCITDWINPKEIFECFHSAGELIESYFIYGSIVSYVSANIPYKKQKYIGLQMNQLLL